MGRAKKKKDNYYVDPKRFKEAIATYYETGEWDDYLGDCVNKISSGLSHNSKFSGYSYRDEMVGDAVVKMYAALKNQNFDVNSQYNPFSYFTTIAFRSFINRIKKEKRLHQAETDYREEFYERRMIESSDGMVYTKKDNIETEDFFDEDCV